MSRKVVYCNSMATPTVIDGNMHFPMLLRTVSRGRAEREVVQIVVMPLDAVEQMLAEAANVLALHRQPNVTPLRPGKR